MRDRRITAVSAALVLVIFLISSCATTHSGDVQARSEITVVDYFDSEVSLTQRPSRVAALFSSLADAWICAGGDVAITVGESVERGLVGEDAILVDGGAGKTIDIEALIAAEPDLILCSADVPAQVAAMPALRAAGIPCGAFRIESFEDYLEVLRTFAEITGHEEKYEENGLRVAQRIDELLAGTDADGSVPILFIRAGSTARSTKAKTYRESFVCEMLRELGTVNIAESAATLLDGLSVEEVLRAQPERIFVSFMGDEAAARANVEAMFKSEAWQNVAAVREGRVTYLPKELFQYKPNARWAEAYEYLIHALLSTGA